MLAASLCASCWVGQSSRLHMWTDAESMSHFSNVKTLHFVHWSWYTRLEDLQSARVVIGQVPVRARRNGFRGINEDLTEVDSFQETEGIGVWGEDMETSKDTF